MKIKAFKEETDKNETRNRSLRAGFIKIHVFPYKRINSYKYGVCKNLDFNISFYIFMQFDMKLVRRWYMENEIRLYNKSLNANEKVKMI